MNVFNLFRRAVPALGGRSTFPDEPLPAEMTTDAQALSEAAVVPPGSKGRNVIVNPTDDSGTAGTGGGAGKVQVQDLCIFDHREPAALLPAVQKVREGFAAQDDGETEGGKHIKQATLTARKASGAA
jgi:hypothetical protein